MKTLLALASIAGLLAPAIALGQASEPTRAFLTQNCQSCHNERTTSARVYGGPRLSLETLDVNNVRRDAAAWESILVRLRTGMMPPLASGGRKPPAAELRAAIQYIEDELDRTAEVYVPRIVPHRLNRTEYGTAVRELLGIPVEADRLLPPDDSTHGFDNIASALQLSPDVEKAFESAARQVSVRAITDSKKIFVCRPIRPADEAVCARTILTGLASSAFRGAATPADLDELMGVYANPEHWYNSFDSHVGDAIAHLLQSPKFLFRTEVEPRDVKPGEPYRISDLDLASRLSFFLWSTGPDQELLTVAAAGGLKDPTILAAQTTRMLKDPRSEALSNNVAGQWLDGRSVWGALPRTSLYPDFDSSLRQAMQRELELFFDSIVREDRSVTDLLDADYTFLNEQLARHYGIPNIAGPEYRRVTLSGAFDVRRGVLGKGAMLASTSKEDRTSPVFRGRWIDMSLLGVSPPLPRPNEPPIPRRSNDPNAKEPSVREKMVSHGSTAECITCHRMMDPLGLALENFDLVGMWRTEDGDSPVDPADTLYDGTRVSGPADLRRWLLDHSDQFVQVMTAKLLTYALGRGVEFQDTPVVRSIARAAARNNNRFSAIVMGIVTSDTFHMNARRE
jgi:hypothetical protein